MSETWRPIAGYEGWYEVSDHGRIRGLDRVIPYGQGVGVRRGQLLQPSASGSGYLKVALRKEGSYRQRLVHQLVLEAFIGPRPFTDAVSRHLNGDSRDNRRENLCWGTQAENIADKFSHGTDHNSNKTHCKWGHEYTPENTVHQPGRPAHHRICRACRKRRNDARKSKVVAHV